MGFMESDRDFQAGNWWSTVSGAGTDSAAMASWADDYTRHRSGGLRSTYTSPDDLIGRKDYQKYDLGTDDPTTVSGEGTILR
jgi:hypothetical protein